jgi:hypothetical protein
VPHCGSGRRFPSLRLYGMGAQDPPVGADAAEAVRAAARLSLAADGVRVCRWRSRQSEKGWTEPWSWELGVADPLARAVQWCHHLAEESPWTKLAEAAGNRWPWLSDDAATEQATEVGYETIEIGRTVYGGGANGWWMSSDEPRYLPSLGLWPLEMLLASTSAERAGSTETRGVACERYLGEAHPGKVAALATVKLIDAPAVDDDWRVVCTDVSIDAQGFVRRIAWSPTTGTRFTPGLVARLAGRLDRSPAGHPTDSEGRPWYWLELWDYGIKASVRSPAHVNEHHDVPLHVIARDLWRVRSQYRRRHSEDKRA